MLLTTVYAPSGLITTKFHGSFRKYAFFYFDAIPLLLPSSCVIHAHHASRQIGLFGIFLVVDYRFPLDNSSKDSSSFWLASISPTTRLVLFLALLNCTMLLQLVL